MEIDNTDVEPALKPAASSKITALTAGNLLRSNNPAA